MITISQHLFNMIYFTWCLPAIMTSIINELWKYCKTPSELGIILERTIDTKVPNTKRRQSSVTNLIVYAFFVNDLSERFLYADDVRFIDPPQWVILSKAPSTPVWVDPRIKLPQTLLQQSPFDHVHIELVGPLPSFQVFTYLLTMVDRFCCWPEAVPTDDLSAELSQ